MNAEWLTAIATVGTFVVIAASAVAALIQIRHMRGSNQITAMIECRETAESPAFRQAQSFVLSELPKRLADPAESARAAQLPFGGEYAAVGTVANFFETLGAFVKHGIIDKEMACDLWSDMALATWNALAPVVTYLRENRRSDALWENFEYMAALSVQFLEEHPSTYPSGTAHMPADRSLIEVLRATSEAR